jgi:hypothetical protein
LDPILIRFREIVRVYSDRGVDVRMIRGKGDSRPTRSEIIAHTNDDPDPSR